MAAPCQLQLLLVLLVVVVLQSASQLVAAELKANFEELERDYTVQSEKKYVGDLRYEVHNFTFPLHDAVQADRVKRDLSTGGTLCVMTFNIKNYAAPSGPPRTKDGVIPRILNSCDLIAVQEMKNQAAPVYIRNQLNMIAGANAFGMVQSNQLPHYFAGQPGYAFDTSVDESYAIFYRRAILTYKRSEQENPIALSGGYNQRRAPFAAEFTYFSGLVRFDITIVTIHTQPVKPNNGLKTRQEIDGLHGFINRIMNPPLCYSGNAIIMGDFNQGTNYISNTWQSLLDMSPEFEELTYVGGSTSAVVTPQKHDRIYTHGYLNYNNIAFGATTCFVDGNGNKARIVSQYDTGTGATSPIHIAHIGHGAVSDHHPVSFYINTRALFGRGLLPFKPWTCVYDKIVNTMMNTFGRRRRQTNNMCQSCFDSPLIGGVYPTGATSSSTALNITPRHFGRDDSSFLNFKGSRFIFSNEEQHAVWCGSTERPCVDCRGTTDDVSIVNQCADRIMCPNLAAKIIVLLQHVDNCFGENRTIIIHEAWDELDSMNPFSQNDATTLHGQGLEAKISVSQIILTFPTIEEEKDYSSDASLLNDLASLARCVGFEYIRINSDSTISVAVSECYNSETKVPLCIEPPLTNGRYTGAHSGPKFQYGEVIYAVCHTGYRLSGQIARRCIGINESLWTGVDPECIKVCEDFSPSVFNYLTNTMNLEIDCDNANMLKCNHTSRLFEIAQVSTCVKDDNSSMCQIPIDPYDGFSSFIYGSPGDACSVVEFSCENGSRLIGEPILTCQPNGEFDFPLPTCSGDLSITDFTVNGFQYLRASVPVNPLDTNSLASASYDGQQYFPYPQFTSHGQYNTTIDRVMFREAVVIPFISLSLSYSVEVKLNVLSFITKQIFHGHLSSPFVVDITGVYDAVNCVIDLAGYVYVPSEELTVSADVGLVYCDNCTRICAAQSVDLFLNLTMPWNIVLNGSYMLSDNVTTVSVFGHVVVSGYDIQVSTSVYSEAGQVTIQDFALDMHLPSPLNIDIHGSYSRVTGQARFSGSLNIPLLQLMLQLSLDVDNEEFTDITFSGTLSQPFGLSLYGTYSLQNNSNTLLVGGSLDIAGFVSLDSMVNIDLIDHTILFLSLSGTLEQPLLVRVSGNYNVDQTENLNLAGTIQLYSSSLVNVGVNLNASGGILSLEEIVLAGTFPPPLDFISYKGSYNRSCSCAFLFGSVVQTYVNIVLSTTLHFAQGQTPSINGLDVQVVFHRPINLQLTGQYIYSNISDNNLINVEGKLNIPQIFLSSTLQLIVEGMSSFTLSQLHFEGTFPSPLSLHVEGDYNSGDTTLNLLGRLNTAFMQLNASVAYSFRDDVHNVSSMLSNVHFLGRLTDPLLIDIEGQYSFSSNMFLLMGMLTVNQYLTLSTDVSINTQMSPLALEMISFSGELTTPIAFEGNFHGVYSQDSDTIILNSQLQIVGSPLLEATATVVRVTNSSFTLESIMIRGTLAPPLLMQVDATYIPSNASLLEFTGVINIEGINFMAQARIKKDIMMDQMLLREVIITGSIEHPLSLLLSGVYMTGNTLLLGASLDFSELSLRATALVNLTKVPREVENLQFTGHLTSPFNATVSGQYSNGLVLSGMFDLSSLLFTVNVFFNTTNGLSVNTVQFSTFYNPLNLNLVGNYDRLSQKLGLTGYISIPTPPINITATTNIDMSQAMQSLSSFIMTAEFQTPPLHLSGVYDPSMRSALLRGVLMLDSFTFQASALLDLGANKHLQDIIFSVNYTIRFGSRLQLMLTGMFESDRGWLVTYGRISSQSSNSIDGLLIVSTAGMPYVLSSLIIPDLDIGSLVSEYIGFSWPSDAFPLMFRDVRIYQSEQNVTFAGIDYKTGLHARAETKIFIFPEIVIDATLTDTFTVDFMLKRPLDWSIIAICGATDTFCNTTGPSLQIQVNSEMNRFSFIGGFRLFNVKVGNLELVVTKDIMEATITLSEQITRNLLGLSPGPITIYWNDEGFHTNLRLPGLMIDDFEFTNVQSRDICATLGGYISQFAIDAPFHLNSTFVAREVDNTTLFLGVIFGGYVDLEIASEPVLTVPISPKAIGVRIPKGETLSWSLFVRMLEQGLKSAAEQIVNDLLKDSRAVALFAGGRLGQLVVDEVAQAICESLLNSRPPPPPPPAPEPFQPLDFPLFNPSALASIGPTAVTTVTCLIFSIFGGCRSSSSSDDDDDDRSEEHIAEIQDLWRLSCSSGFCDQNCVVLNDMIQCSCNDGYFLDIDGHSCIRYDRCHSDSNPCDSHAYCMDPANMNHITCHCFDGYHGNGYNCTEINECQDGTANCPPHSMCSNTEGSFLCNCDSGFIKSDNSCEDVNECTDGTAVCSAEHSHCTNTEGGYQCDCDTGFSYINESTCADINECESEGICGVHSACTNTIGSYICSCNMGYVRVNNTICEDIDECSESTPCDQRAICNNTDGSYTCTCMEGFLGNGTYCVDIDECQMEDVCMPNSTCINLLGSYSCICYDGFVLSDSQCIDIDECDTSLFDCVPEAECVNTIGSYECACLPGYTGNGTICDDVNECNATSDVCTPHSECVNTPGSFFCPCVLGYSGSVDGRCIDIDECLQPDVCDEMASCENTNGSFTCTCEEEFVGDGFTCSLVSCRVLNLTNARYIFNEGNMYNQTVIVECLPGFIPTGTTELTCQINGEWSNQLPDCMEDITCFELAGIPHGEVHYTLLSTITNYVQPGSVAHYSCDVGYTLEGADTATCLNNGNWSEYVPTCVIGLSFDYLFPFGAEFGDSILQENDDGVAHIPLTVFFPFFDNPENSLFLSNNGLLSFRVPMPAYTPEPFPIASAVIAPFWADVDTRTINGGDDIQPTNSSDDIGNVWYREEFSPTVLDKARREIKDAFFEHSDFVPTSLFIVTWHNVGYYPIRTDKLNTFQCVLATDGQFSFVIFLYPRGGIQWTTGDASDGSNGLGGIPAQVGFNAGDGIRYYALESSRTNDVVNVDEMSNVMKPGLYIYRVDGTSITGGCSTNEENVTINVLPLTGNALGGSLLTLTGPCFNSTSSLRCDFGYGSTSTVVVASPLRAYCPIPMLFMYGPVDLKFNGESEDVSYPTLTFISVSPDYSSKVFINMPGILLYSDGDNVTLTWTPTDLLSEAIALPSHYQVQIELYLHDFREGWYSIQDGTLGIVNNTGEFFVASLPVGPFHDLFHVPAIFSISVVDSNSLPGYIRPVTQNGAISIWSPVFYKTTIIQSPRLTVHDFCSSYADNSLESPLPSCPCRVEQARIGNSMFVEQRSTVAHQQVRFFYPGANTCFLSSNNLGDFGGQECCYDDSGLLISGPPNGGTRDLSPPHATQDFKYHAYDDVLPQIACCKSPESSASTCEMYYSARPSDNCASFNPNPPALLFGDPHMITLDGLMYTYNGAGEYTVLYALDGEFIFQARTEPVERTDGGDPIATAFTAIAVKTNTSDTVEIQQSSFRGVNILVNGIRLIFSAPTDWTFTGVSVSYLGNDTVSVLFDNGQAITAQNTNNFLLVQISGLPNSYRNSTKGLLGNWNGVAEDDLLTPDGTILSPNATLREIHELFGELWRINGNESLFTYVGDQSAEMFNDLTFTPILDIADLPFSNMSGVTEICGDSFECLFDVGATGDIEVGQVSVQVQITYNETIEISRPVVCVPECQHDAPCVDFDVCNCPPQYTGERCETDVDECVLGIHNCDQSCTNTNGSFSCSCPIAGYELHPNEASCVDVDECLSNNGGCQCHSVVYNSTYTCVATCHNVPGSHECSCNVGYVLDSDGRTCIDVEECSSNNGGCRCDEGLTNCTSFCTELHGSFTCGCNDGFELDTDGLTCIDIDECSIENGGCGCDATAESSTCIGVCTNLPGSYQCSCSDGYQLNDGGLLCIDTDECLQNNGGCMCHPILVNSSCEATCINTNGSHICGCNFGYELNDEITTICTDVNECLDNDGGCQCDPDLQFNNTCTAECMNTFGSYHCECSSGYHTNGSALTCSDIDECTVNNGGCHCSLLPGGLNDDNCIAHCINSEGYHECICSQGYCLDEDQLTCHDINECSIDNGGCACHSNLQGSTCVPLCLNEHGYHHCECNEGYKLEYNTTTCIDINECETDNGGCHCESNNANCTARCSNTIGSFYCQCNIGHILHSDRTTCIEETLSEEETQPLLSTTVTTVIAVVVGAITCVAIVLMFVVIPCFRKMRRKAKPPPVGSGITVKANNLAVEL